MIIDALRFQLGKIRQNPITFFLIALTSVITIYVGYRHGTVKNAIVYLCVMWLCAYTVELYALYSPAKAEFIVRNPKRETIYFLTCVFLGSAFLYFRTSPAIDWQHLPGLVKLAIIPLIIFVFPIALAIIMLLLKYKPKELGLRLKGLPVAVPVIFICFITNRVFFPESLTLTKILEESGSIWNAMLTGFIAAGLSEEFFKTIGQTRIGALLKNNGLGWFITTIIWALLHAPKWYQESSDITEALLSAVRIVPIGLMWGYITHRTKSFLPATIVHGMNVWGLQNF
jgi:membrane protease YdiL (CAAX protease family)